MISIRDLSMKFGRAAALEGVSLDVASGESVALWGSNGAGKSTLLRCVLGLLRFSGSIHVGGIDVQRRGKVARMLVGYVPQEIGFYDDVAVGRAIALFAGMKGVDRTAWRGALERVGLAGHEHKRVRDLSGGMKQRLALAIALLGDPPVLIMDEVTASLDAVGRDGFVKLLSELGAAGRTLLFASHREDEIQTLAHRVIVLHQGRIEQERDARTFARAGSEHAVLHLTIPQLERQRAIELLNLRGFSSTLNGVGVLVPVMVERKAEPFRVLAEAAVPIQNFEVLTAQQAERMHHPEGRP